MSLESYRLRYTDYLEKNYLIRDDHVPGACILDFGCGSGWSIVAGLDLGFDMWGLDIDPKYIQISEPEDHKAYHKKEWKIKHRLKWYDGMFWPYPDGMFDLITAIVSWDKDFTNAPGGNKGPKFFLRHHEAIRTLKRNGYLMTSSGGKARFFTRKDLFDIIEERR